MSFIRDSSGDIVNYYMPSTVFTNATALGSVSTLYDNTGTSLSISPGIIDTENNSFYSTFFSYSYNGTYSSQILIATAPINTTTPIGTRLYQITSAAELNGIESIVFLGTVTSKEGNLLYFNNSVTSIITINTNNFSLNSALTFPYATEFIFNSWLPITTSATKTISISTVKGSGLEEYSQCANFYISYNGSATPSGDNHRLWIHTLGNSTITVPYFTKTLKIQTPGYAATPILTCTNGSYEGTVLTITDPTQATTITLYDYSYCLTGDTLVTMSDRSTKRLDEIEVGDKVLSIDPSTGKLVEDEVVFTDKDENKSHTEYDLWEFSDNYFVKTVHRHRFYNVEDNCFTYMDRWRIGDHTINNNGEILELLSHKIIQEEVKHYKITTKQYHNYFANGMLTGSRLTENFDYKNLKLGVK